MCIRDSSIGTRMSGLMAAAGLEGVMSFTNDRCMELYPPYDRGDMQVELEQELAWARQDIGFFGTRNDCERLFRAGGREQDGNAEDFDAHWKDVLDFLRHFERSVAEQRYSGGRGYLMYVVGGRVSLV